MEGQTSCMEEAKFFREQQYVLGERESKWHGGFYGAPYLEQSLTPSGAS